MRQTRPEDPFGPWLARWGLLPDGTPILTVGSSLLPVRRGDRSAMLKVAHAAEERFGAALMVWWGGHGAAAVLAHEGAALMTERATGPCALADLARSSPAGDDEATRILCGTVAALHAPRPQPAPALIPLERWFEALLAGHGRYGGVTSACADAARGLLAAPRDLVVLHGDVHHANVLDFGARGWLAIDPKALHGERAFDYVNLFRNPDANTATAPGLFARRLSVVCEAAGLERTRLLRWILAFAGLSSVWLREDGDEPADDLAIIDLAAAALARS